MQIMQRTVDDYIASSPAWARRTLRELRRAIRSATPKSKESISYRMPYYSQNGRVAYFAAFKTHCSFFWISASDKNIFRKDLATQEIVGNTLRIPVGSKVPFALIKKIVRSRVRENEARKRGIRQS